MPGRAPSDKMPGVRNSSGTDRPFGPARIIIFFILPLGLGLGLLGMYFSSNLVLQRLVSPKLPPLNVDLWREFGLLESLQVLFLLAIVAISTVAVFRKKTRLERTGFLVIALVSLFVLLEETDYGLTYVAYAQSPTDIAWFTPEAQWPEDLLVWLKEVKVL